MKAPVNRLGRAHGVASLPICVGGDHGKLVVPLSGAEAHGPKEPIEIHRRGKVVARLLPASKVEGDAIPAWEQLRGSGELQMEPEESVLQASEFEAAR